MAKQHISQKSKGDAVNQVDLRLEILGEWCRAGIPWKTTHSGDLVRDADGEAQLDYSPSNLTEFVSWIAEKNCKAQHEALTGLRTISRSTLGQPYHNETKRKVLNCLALVAERRKSQYEQANKATRIGSQAAELAYLRKVVAAQEMEARSSRLQVSNEVTARRKEHSLRLRNEKQLQSELLSRDKRIAELTQALAKVSPLRKS